MMRIDLTNKNENQDFLAFNLDGESSLKYKIYRTINDLGFKENLAPDIVSTSYELANVPGSILLESKHKQKKIVINFAINGATERELHLLKVWLLRKGEKSLWFPESPYKVYTVLLGERPQINVSPTVGSNGRRIYYGTGTVTFVTTQPYSRTPDEVKVLIEDEQDQILSGDYYTSYVGDSSYQEFFECLPRQKDEANKAKKLAFGQLPFYFKATLMSPFEAELESILVSNIDGERITTKSKPLSGEDTDMATRTYTIQHSPDSSGFYTKTITLTISVEEDIYTDYQWDSKTGLVTAALKNNVQKRVVLSHTGDSVAQIDPGPFQASGLVNIDHNYLYY